MINYSTGISVTPPLKSLRFPLKAVADSPSERLHEARLTGLFASNVFKRVPTERKYEIRAMIEKGFEKTALWDSQFLNQSDMLGKAFYMYYAGLLDSDRLMHAVLWDSAKETPGAVCLSGEESLQTLKQAFLPPPTWDSQEISKSWEKRVCEAIDSLPSQLDPADLRIILDPTQKLSRIRKEAAEALFIPKINETTFCILPPKLLRHLLFHLFGKQALSPQVVLGYREIEELSNPLMRVMSISSRFSPVQTVHGERQLQHTSMYIHDMWHLFTDSANPHRAACVEIAKKIKDPALEQMRLALLDRSTANYINRQIIANETALRSEEKIFRNFVTRSMNDEQISPDTLQRINEIFASIDWAKHGLAPFSYAM